MRAHCSECGQDLTRIDVLYERGRKDNEKTKSWSAKETGTWCKDEKSHKVRLFEEDKAEAEFRLLAYKVAEVNGISFQEGYDILAVKSLENLEKLGRARDALNP